MQFSNWLVFCGVALVVTFTPGPGVLLAVSNSVALGLRLTAICSLGVALGLFIVSGTAMAGMGVALAASAAAFAALKVAGAVYLVFLGIKQWRNSARPLADVGAPSGTLRTTHAGWRLFREGLTLALTNPKAILFFPRCSHSSSRGTNQPLGNSFCLPLPSWRAHCCLTLSMSCLREA